jgi:hypothetical protein
MLGHELRELLRKELPSELDHAMVVARRGRLETDQGPTYQLVGFTSDPLAATATVYASRNLMVRDGVCGLDILILSISRTQPHVRKRPACFVLYTRLSSSRDYA